MIKTFENFNSDNFFDLSKEMEGYYHDLIDDAGFKILSSNENEFTLFGNEEGVKDIIEEFIERIEDMENKIIIIKNYANAAKAGYKSGDIFLTCLSKNFLAKIENIVANWLKDAEVYNDKEGIWIKVEKATQALIFIDASPVVYINDSFASVCSERLLISKESFMGFMKYYVLKYYKKYIITNDIYTYSPRIPMVPRGDIAKF